MFGELPKTTPQVAVCLMLQAGDRCLALVRASSPCRRPGHTERIPLRIMLLRRAGKLILVHSIGRDMPTGAEFSDEEDELAIARLRRIVSASLGDVEDVKFAFVEVRSEDHAVIARATRTWFAGDDLAVTT